VLSKDLRHAFEFRDPGSFRRETCDILERTLEKFYGGACSGKLLEGWGEKISFWKKEGKTIYVFFDNTMEGDSVTDAMKCIQNDGLDRNSEVLN